MKKILSFLSVASLVFLGMYFVAHAAPITPVTGGGTQTSSIQNGYLLIGNASGTYNQIASSSLGSSATTTINGVAGPTFTLSIVGTSSASSITTTTAQLFLNLLQYTSGTDINVASNGVINFLNPGFSTLGTTTAFTSGYLPVTSSSLALTNSIIYQALPIASSTTYKIPTLVNKCTTHNNANNSHLNCSLGTVTAGDLIVVQVHTFSATSSITDAGSDSFTTSTQLSWDGGSGSLFQFYATNVAGGASYSVTSTYPSSTFTYMAVQEYSGIATSSPLDATSTKGTQGQAAGVFSSGTSTTSLAGELIIGSANCNDSSGVVTAGTGFLAVATSSGGCDITEATNTTAIGSYSVPFNISNSSDNVGADMATFKPAVSSSIAFVPAELGINTTTPANPLDVNGSADVQGNLAIGTTTTNSANLYVNGSIGVIGSSTIITPSIGGTITTSGCDSATSSVAGYGLSSTTTGFFTTPENYPGPVSMYTMLTTSSTITTYVCADITITPTSTAYVVKIIK